VSADKTELRGLVPTHLAQALDAIAMARGMDRNTYVTTVLEKEVKQVAHETSVISRVMRGNPYLMDADGGSTEPRSRFHAGGLS